MKDVRLYSTENEKIAKELLGTDSNFTSVNMKENSLDSLIKKEKARKFNSEVEKYNEKLSTLAAYKQEIERIENSLKNLFEEEED